MRKKTTEEKSSLPERKKGRTAGTGNSGSATKKDGFKADRRKKPADGEFRHTGSDRKRTEKKDGNFSDRPAQAGRRAGTGRTETPGNNPFRSRRTGTEEFRHTGSERKVTERKESSFPGKPARGERKFSTGPRDSSTGNTFRGKKTGGEEFRRTETGRSRTERKESPFPERAARKFTPGRTESPRENTFRGKKTFGNTEKSPASEEKRPFRTQPASADNNKPSFFKGLGGTENSDKPRNPRREKLSENRQTGLTYAPKYNEEKMKKHLPPKIQKNLKREEKGDTIRLNRYIANAGLCSRREADEFISSGQITVNGKVITEMGYKVQPGDVVKYGRKILNPEKIVYVLLNKPKDFITTTEDPEERKTVMDLVAQAGPERIYPVGRLDRLTTGLLLLTNDGELADKLSHPSNGIKKVYQAELNKPLSQEHFNAILSGIELEDGFIKADDLAIITPDNEVVGIEIHSGRNRIVRRIFEHLGYEILKLDRTVYAGLTKKDLPRGKWRFLTEKEVIRLKYMI